MSSQTPTVPGPRSSERPLALLRSGIPLTLLIDLADPLGPPSAQIYDDELHDAALALGAGGASLRA